MTELNNKSQELLNSFEDLLNKRGTNTKTLKYLYESYHIAQDLVVGFDDYFHMSAILWLSLKRSVRGNFYLLSCEDNIGIDELYKNKNFNHKSFEIKKLNGRRHVLQISIEAGAALAPLHDNDFISYLIRNVNQKNYDDKTSLNHNFDNNKESVHFVYCTDGYGTKDEIVLLSVQSFI